MGRVQGTLKLSPKDKEQTKQRVEEEHFRAGTVSSGTGLGLAGLRRNVTASGAGEEQEGTGLPAGPVDSGQQYGLPPEGTGEL